MASITLIWYSDSFRLGFYSMPLSDLINYLVPEKYTVTHKEMLIASASAFFGLLLLTYTSSIFISGPALPILVASMGASSVLLFAAPASPMSKPWAFIGGQLVSGIIGVSCYRYIHDLAIAVAVAVALSMFMMHILRCLHPPGGATALAAILGGPEIHTLGYAFVITPVAINVFILLTFSLIINELVNRRKHIFSSSGNDEPLLAAIRGITPFSKTDLTAALKDLDTYIDVSQDDLNEIFSLALVHSKMRDTQDIYCKDIMQKDPITFEFGSELEESWLGLHKNNLTTAPVVDKGNHLLGLIDISNFIDNANMFSDRSLTQRLTKLIKQTPGFHSNKPEVVGQIMLTDINTVSESDPIDKLMGIFSATDAKLIPVLDRSKKLSGTINKTDLVKALA